MMSGGKSAFVRPSHAQTHRFSGSCPHSRRDVHRKPRHRRDRKLESPVWHNLPTISPSDFAILEVSKLPIPSPDRGPPRLSQTVYKTLLQANFFLAVPSFSNPPLTVLATRRETSFSLIL